MAKGLDSLEWQLVPAASIQTYRKSAKVAAAIRKVVDDVCPYGPLELWWSPYENSIWLPDTKIASELGKGVLDAVDDINVSEAPEPPKELPGWLETSRARPIPALNRVATWLNWSPGEYAAGIPNHPHPLGALISGGLVGGGLGYGAGWLGERVLPDNWKRKNLRRTLAVLGTGLGMLPGLAKAYVNYNTGHGMTDTFPYITNPDTGWSKTSMLAGTHELPWSAWNKAASFTSRTGLGYDGPPLDVYKFRHTIWADPSVAEQLPGPVQAAADGIVSGASQLAGGARVITPFDMGRMAVGMGSGYLSGALVGKGLGLLMGAPPSVQQKLKTTGTWAGVVANLVPMVFGR